MATHYFNGIHRTVGRGLGLLEGERFLAVRAKAVFELIDIDPRIFLRQHCTLPILPGAVDELQRVIHSSDA